MTSPGMSSTTSTGLSDDVFELGFPEYEETYDEAALIYVTWTFSLVSAVSSLLVIVTFWRFERLHTFAYKIICALAVANFGLDSAYLMGEVGVDNWACTLQGFGRVYFALVGFALVTAITMTCYVMIVRRDFSIQQLFWRVMAYCWLIPLVMACLPFTTNNYGDGGAWCSITSKDYQALVWGTFWRFAIIYVPLWLCVAINAYMCFKVFRAMRGLEAAMAAYVGEEEGDDGGGASEGDPGGNTGQGRAGSFRRRSSGGLEVSSSIPIIERLRLYPIALVICWSWATINRVHEALNPTGDTIFWLFILQYTFQAMQGFLNLMIFLRTPGVKEEWREVIKKWRLVPFRRTTTVDASALLGGRSVSSSSSAGSVTGLK